MKSNKRRYEMTARTAKAEATKARIRVSAMELYCERPVEDFTLEEVAERAGVAVRHLGGRRPGGIGLACERR